jgi:oligopeptide transport system substrate-binding protein
LLAEAGYPGGRGLPRLAFFEVARQGDTSTPGVWLRDQLAASLGLDIDLKQIPPSAMPPSLAQEGPKLWAMGWSADYTDPDSFMRQGNWPAVCNWQNQTFVRLVEDARSEIDQDRRLSMYRQAEKILVEQAPFVPLIYSRWHILVKPWVRRFATSPTVWTIFKDVLLDDGEEP